MGEGQRLKGHKFYSTGALLANWIPVVVHQEYDRKVMAIAGRRSDLT
ncbi:MAG: hypothetical protein ACAF41_01970 [Leptolyngbya sp. BL-A-14]